MTMMNLVTLTEPQGAAAEAYQSLRTNLEFSNLDKSVHTLVLAGTDASVDAEAAAANLAVVMAQAGDRVLLVDGNLRQPRLHELVGLPNASGVSTWLVDGGAPPVQKTTVDGFQVLTAGPALSNPLALLSTKRLHERLAELRALADYVLVVAPPVLSVTDAAIWASQTEGVLLLVNAGSTKRDQAQQAKAVLERVQARILGAVLLNAERG
jgi:non-specific protein-tyrosine kinase